MLLGSRVTVNNNRKLKVKPIGKEYMNVILHKHQQAALDKWFYWYNNNQLIEAIKPMSQLKNTCWQIKTLEICSAERRFGEGVLG
jgi:hypothetical protein